MTQPGRSRANHFLHPSPSKASFIAFEGEFNFHKYFAFLAVADLSCCCSCRHRIAIAIAIATALLCVWLVSLRFSALGSFGFGTPGFFAQTCAAPQALPRPLQQRQVRQYGKKRLGCTWLGGGEYEWAGHKKFKLKMFYAWANHNKARKCHFLLTKRIL